MIMKRIILLISIFVVAAGGVWAQEQVRTWQSGPLTWADFTHQKAIADRCSYLEYFMGVDGSSHRSGGIDYLMPEAYAFISPTLSWADTHYRSAALLRTNQVAFALLELHRRYLQSALLATRLFDSQQMVDTTMRSLADEIDRLERETRYGQDTAALLRWETLVGQRLAAAPSGVLTSHVDAPWRWGLSALAGVNVVGGGLQRYFSHGLGMGFYFDMGVRRHFALVGLSAAGARCLAEAVDRHHGINTLYVDDPLSMLHFFAAYGYAVVDNARIRLTPFVGFGLHGVYYAPGGDNSSLGPSTGSLHVGLDFHHYISNQVEWNPFLIGDYNATHNLVSFNARLFATYDRFAAVEGCPQGFSVNLQVGIGLMMGKARCR